MSPSGSQPWSPTPVAVSVILPTYNEAANIGAVVAVTQAALWAIPNHEILVVDDDSPDQTWSFVDAIGRTDRRVRCHRRLDNRGLASAIFDGLGLALGESLVVMDADLQHDPWLIPKLAAALGKADIAVASRYQAGGSTAGWSVLRRGVSRLATWLGRRFLKLTVSDPMSGFFAMRRDAFQGIAGRLQPRGFKALLEILVRARGARIVELPYEFGARQAGTSKLGREVVGDYLLSLLELRIGRRLSTRFIRYCLVGLSGVIVQLVVLLGLQSLMDSRTALAIAILCAMVSNFCLNNAWTFRDRRLTSWAFSKGLIRFVAVCAGGAAVNYSVSMVFHSVTGIPLLWSSLTGISVATVWNYQLNRMLTWGGGGDVVHGANSPTLDDPMLGYPEDQE